MRRILSVLSLVSSQFFALATLLTAPLVPAQTPPQAFSYQALVRDGVGAAVRDQRVGVQISLRQDSANATASYAETFTPSTNGFGNVNLSIGQGNVTRGTFAALDWSRPMFIEVGVDITGGSTYTLLGATQLLSVPYALYSARSATVASVNLSEIRDGDGNTRVSTERSSNENIIRFDLAGTEKMRLRGNALEFPNTGLSVYIGDSAGANVSAGNRNNVFVGDRAGRSNTTGFENTFAGNQAGYSNTTGWQNTFAGSQAGYSNTTGLYNTFAGAQAGYSNTTGNYNTFAGSMVGFYNSTGNFNTFEGHQAGYNNTMGTHNTFAGSYAGRSNITGTGNTFAGSNAGYNNTTGYGNVYIGFNAGPLGDDTEKLYVNNAQGAPLIWGDFAADSVRIDGGMSVARSVTAVSFVNSSDRRLKENIAPLPNVLDRVGKIQGVYYNFKAKAPDGNPYPQGRQIGVIAQDVEKIYPELVATQPGGYKAVDYPKLTAVLIEAVKELEAKNAKLEAANREMMVWREKVEAALRLTQLERDGEKVARH